MTSDEEARRVAEALDRRERQRSAGHSPGGGTSLDPVTLKAFFEKYEGEVTKVIGETETALTERIDKLVEAQGEGALGLRREIEEKVKKGVAGEMAALERRLKDGQRSALETLSKNLKREYRALKASLDAREGGVFAEIDGVAEKVKPAAAALGQLQHAVAGTAAAATDMAAIRDAVVDSRNAVDEVVTIRKTVARSESAIVDVVAMRPLLERIETGFGTWSRSARRRRRFGWILVILLSLAFGTAGVWLQRETGIWPTEAEIENRERDAFWERHGEQVTHCIEEARTLERGMACTILDFDP